MITKFKIFEEDSKELTYDEERKLEIEYELRKIFDSESEFDEWCKDQEPDSDPYEDEKFSFFNPGDVRDLSNVASYDIPNLLNLPVNDPKTTEIISDILTDIDFNKPKFDNFEDFKKDKLAQKYNL